MTIAADARYRSVSLTWTNNDAIGNELVQVLAKPNGGAWSVVTTYAVGASPQSSTWNTALPVTAYDVAMRFLNKSVPAVGYESSNPDDWTAPTAAGSKATVETTSAGVTWGTAGVTATVATLNWSSAQTGVPYLLEKDAGAGFVTVVADLVATSYAYTIPPAELNTTVTFRVTAQRGAIVGPTAGTLDVYLGIAIGTPFLHWLKTSGVAGNIAGRFYVGWNRASVYDRVEFVQLRRANSATGFTVWTELAVSGYSAPAVEDVPVQTSAFVPAGIVAQNLASHSSATWDEYQVRAGVNNGSGIQWGAWQSDSFYVDGDQAVFTPVAPTVTFGALTATTFAMTATIPTTGGGAFAYAGAIVCSTPITQAANWGMLLAPLADNSSTSPSLVIPSDWRGQGLYEEDFDNFRFTGGGNTRIVATSTNGHTTTLVGTIP